MGKAKYFAIISAYLVLVGMFIAGLFRLMIFVSEKTGSPELALLAGVTPVILMTALWLDLMDERS